MMMGPAQVPHHISANSKVLMMYKILEVDTRPQRYRLKTSSGGKGKIKKDLRKVVGT
jgi:hypothetical protein